VAIVWNIIRDLRNRAKLVVKAQIGPRSIGFDGIKADYVRVDLTNVGKRPLTVVAIGFKLTSSNSWTSVHSSDLPKELGEAQTHPIYVLPQEIGQPEEVEFVFARDSSGRDYRSKKRPLRSKEH